MIPSQSILKKNRDILLIYFASLFIFVALFLFRSSDDNRLFSWQWVFQNVDAGAIFLILMPGLGAAYLLARIRLYERNPGAFLFLFSFAIGVILWSEPEVIVDASRYFTQAKHLEVYGLKYFFREWGKDITAWTDMPAVPFLYGMIFKIFGEQRIYIQIFVTLLFSMTLILTFRTGKILWNEETGLYAGLFLLGMPYLLTQIPLMLVDVPTMFFLTLSVFTFTKALDKGGAGTIIFSSIALFFAFFSKYSTWAMLTILPVIFFVYLKRGTNITLRRGGAVVLLSALFTAVPAVSKFDVIARQINFLLTYQKPGLERWGESFLSTFFFQIHPFITIAAVSSLFIAIKKRDARYIIISWLIVLVAVFNIKRIRYILPVFPFLALMAAYGVGHVRDPLVKKFIVFCAVFSSLVMAIVAYLPFAGQMSAVNLKKAGEYLNSTQIETLEVFTLPGKDSDVNPSVGVPLLDLFTKKTIRYVNGTFLTPKNVESSPLRFTWEYKNPQYYRSSIGEKKGAVIIISGEPEQAIPPHLKQRLNDYREIKKFIFASDPFLYKTFVFIYVPDI